MRSRRTRRREVVLVRLLDDLCTVSVDSSGALPTPGLSPGDGEGALRETLAAAVLLASGWEGTAPLLGPSAVRGRFPSRRRGWRRRAERRTPLCFHGVAQSFAADVWEEEAGCSVRRNGRRSRRCWHRIRDAGAIRAAEANAARAGVAEALTFACQAVSAITPPPGPGWVVTNPPYGVRVSADKDLRNLYAQLGNVLRLRCPGWRVALLCSKLPLYQRAELPLDTSLAWVNGGLRVFLARGTVPG